MNFLPNIRKDQKGQILIVFLLVLVVGLALALSIASRTVTDIRQTTTSDESNRAYFAAEAGVEKALKAIEENPVTAITPGKVDKYVNLTDVDRAQADVSVTNLTVGDSEVFEIPNSVAQDEVSQVNLIPQFNTISTAGTVDGSGNGILRTDTLNIYWDLAGSSAPLSAIEVGVVTCTNCSATPTYGIKKMVFDTTSRGNNFCTAAVTTGSFSKTTNLGSSFDYRFRATLDLDGPACGNNDVLAAGENPVILRIRPLYNGASTVRLAIENSKLPVQGHKIESIGKTASGVNRKLTVTRLFPALPSLFDYALFNGSSSNPLTKP